jgi:hypothetical protein
MTLDGISVQEAIDAAKKAVAEIEASDEQKLPLETLIIVLQKSIVHKCVI